MPLWVPQASFPYSPICRSLPRPNAGMVPTLEANSALLLEKRDKTWGYLESGWYRGCPVSPAAGAPVPRCGVGPRRLAWAHP